MTEVNPSTVKSKYHSQRKWDGQHAKERWAQRALESALKRNLVERKPCEVCGADGIDGHHDDYDRPLAMRRLCRKHHWVTRQRSRIVAPGRMRTDGKSAHLSSPPDQQANK